MNCITGTVMKKLLSTLTILTAITIYGEEYNYPHKDPIKATAFATKAPKSRIPLKTKSFEKITNRKLPFILEEFKIFKYGVALQRHKAPIIFLIAGTGSHYKTMYLRGLAQSFYKIGMHVVFLSSPTHPNFIINCSTSAIPGIPEQDAKDLNHVMKHILKTIDHKGIYICGYSLGGMNAAFCAKEGTIPFKRVLMINPPVNLYRSISKLDGFLPDNERHIMQTMVKLMHSIPNKGFDLSQKGILESELKEELNNPEKLKELIGLMFRIKTLKMITFSDLMTNSGMIFSKDEVVKLHKFISYLPKALQLKHTDYIENIMIPKFIKEGKFSCRRELIEALDLHKIEDFLKNDPRVFAVTNQDELILNQNDFKFLKETFGKRLKIYPNGGHCGNINFPQNLQHAVKVIKKGNK